MNARIAKPSTPPTARVVANPKRVRIDAFRAQTEAAQTEAAQTRAAQRVQADTRQGQAA
jgi:hypothetical protein